MGKKGPKIDLTGRVFGKWKVLSLSDERSAANLILWTCECACGEIAKIQSQTLINGSSRCCKRCSRLNVTNTYESNPDGVTLVTCSDGSVFKVNTVDLPLVSRYQWYADKRGYIKTKLYGKHIPLPRLLLGVSNEGRNVFVDHVSGDPRDNCRSNLRVCRQVENARNRKINTSNKTGYKGVSFHRKLQKYRADIRAGNHKTIYLGCYQTPEEAAAAYDRAAVLVHGDFARTNAMLAAQGACS